MFESWRAPLHYWSRHTAALKKTALWIVAGGFASAWIFQAVMPRPSLPRMVDPEEQEVRNAWQALYHAPAARPRALSQWLRYLMPRVHHLCDVGGVDYPTWESYQQDGKLAAFEVSPLLRKHAPVPEIAGLFEDFIQAALVAEGDNAAARRLEERAQRPAPPPLANELHGALLVRRGDDQAALTAFIREGQLFGDAKDAREEALRLALRLKDKETLRALVDTPGWLAGMPESLQNDAGWELHDFWLIGKGAVQRRLKDIQLLLVLQALLAAGLWYLILVLQSAPRRWRWGVPLLPIVAGIVSIWPTLWLIAWQENVLGMTEKAPFPHDLWFWIMGVGLREEVSKLALFALFLPWLLWRRAPGLALITGAFVGLGFALEENLDYYSGGGGVALARFLTANFLHVAMTGIAGHALYDLLRSRFARADRFLLTFAGVIVAHGLYDYAASSEIDGMSFLHLAIMVFTTWHFLDLVAHEGPGARQLVAPGAVLLIGGAVLIATIFWISVLDSQSHEGLYEAAKQCIGMAPIFFVYWRRLD